MFKRVNFYLIIAPECDMLKSSKEIRGLSAMRDFEISRETIDNAAYIKYIHDGSIAWCNGVNCYGYCNCRDVMCKNAMYVQNKDGSRIQIEH